MLRFKEKTDQHIEWYKCWKSCDVGLEIFPIHIFQHHFS